MLCEDAFLSTDGFVRLAQGFQCVKIDRDLELQLRET
jgi:hypothetical protein